MLAVNESVSGIIDYMQKACSSVAGDTQDLQEVSSSAGCTCPLLFDCCCGSILWHLKGGRMRVGRHYLLCMLPSVGSRSCASATDQHRSHDLGLESYHWSTASMKPDCLDRVCFLEVVTCTLISTRSFRGTSAWI